MQFLRLFWLLFMFVGLGCLLLSCLVVVLRAGGFVLVFVGLIVVVDCVNSVGIACALYVVLRFSFVCILFICLWFVICCFGFNVQVLRGFLLQVGCSWVLAGFLAMVYVVVVV